MAQAREREGGVNKDVTPPCYRLPKAVLPRVTAFPTQGRVTARGGGGTGGGGDKQWTG